MSVTGSTESRTRGRTRRAILGAAASVLARDRAATLADIAAAAGVGRSTLQRYFPDREELVTAVVADSLDELGHAVAEAALGQGPPRDALRRLVMAMVDVGDRVLFLYGDPRTLERADDASSSPEVIELIERGQAEGVLDTGVDPAWIEHALWALVYAGCDAVGRGTLPRHGAAATVIRTLENGVRLPVESA